MDSGDEQVSPAGTVQGFSRKIVQGHAPCLKSYVQL